MDLIGNIFNLSEYLFWFILVFSLIVFVHEYGHYYIAKINGVKIEKFSIGFGPAILSKKDKHGTLWQISIFPLGGYVKFAGEMYYSEKTVNEEKNDKSLFFNKSSLQKASIVLAGPIANFILGIIIFIIIFSFFGRHFTSSTIGSIDKGSPADLIDLKKGDNILAINNEEIDSFDQIYEILDEKLYKEIQIKISRNKEIIFFSLNPEHKEIKSFIGSRKKINYLGINPIIKPIIGKITKYSPAEKSDLRSNDLIVNINNVEVYDVRKIIDIIKENPNSELNIVINRNNQILNKKIKPSVFITENGRKIGRIGITFSRERIKLSIIDAFIYSIKSFIEVTTKTLIAFAEIIFGKRDHCEVGGPILIAKVSNDVANTDMISFAGLIALISINLGIINLFPLPLLDGGHFFTYMIEYARGKRVKYKIYQYIQYVGVVLIGSLMLFSILNDIYCRVLI
tara:strand:+ start:2505 stop:3866 length:1362 start_codon:yes stop_codon:yes gene_type:complete